MLNKNDVNEFERGMKTLFESQDSRSSIRIPLHEKASYDLLKSRAELRGYIVRELVQNGDIKQGEPKYCMIIQKADLEIGLRYQTDLVSGKSVVTSEQQFQPKIISPEEYHEYTLAFQDLATKLENLTGRRVTGRLELSLGANLPTKKKPEGRK